MRKTLLLTILSVFYLMLLSCSPSETEVDLATVADIDGNVYTTVRIGSQLWTVENLRTTKYNDGSEIPLVTDSAAWVVLTTPGYCYYGNMTNADSIKKFGALYNWYAVDTKKLAPVGWHVPDSTDWIMLFQYLISNGYNWDGTTTGNKIAKSLAAQTDWYTDTTQGTIGCDLTKNNRSGFSAPPGGYRDVNGTFGGIGYFGLWWSASDYHASYAYGCGLTYRYDYLIMGGYLEGCGFLVRLIKD